jgi:RNA polymerase sigma-70 factor (ECF subfamily)
VTEKDLIKGLQTANDGAYRQLVATFQKQVFTTCLSFVHIPADADDLSQEVFIEIFRSAKNFRGDSRLSTWIYRIAVNKSLNHLRKQKRSRWLQSWEDFFSGNSGSDNNQQSDQLSSDLVEGSDRTNQLHQAIDRLPENQRTAFLLSKYDELPTRQIAEIMQTSQSAVDSLIFRAKTNLQKYLYQRYKNNEL